MDSSAKVLVVDDNPMNRELIVAILEEKNLTFDQAVNGKEALQCIKTGSYWLAFIDLLMPGIDGFETIRQIRRSGLKIPIVAVSAISFKQDRQAAFEAGCDFFIPKPVDIDLLVDVLERYQDQFLKQNLSSTNQPPLPETDKPTSDLSDISVLLVEEDDDRRQTFGSFLQNHGCELLVFQNGADAWQHIVAVENKPDIVISNIRMPEIDGLGLLAMVKREYPTISFFLYAPHFDADTIQLAAKEGVDCIVNLETFQETIVEFIETELSKAEAKGSLPVLKSALKQVQQSQERLIRLGCDPPCQFCDIAYAQLHAAGGDVASCRMFNLEGRCGIVLMDVAGHDIVASYLSAVIWGILSSNWNDHQHPRKIAKLLNTELCNLGYDNSHVCLTAALWDPWRRKLAITHAGNPGGIKLTQCQSGTIDVEELKGGGMVVGILRHNEQMVHHELRLPATACSFVFHSDGLELSTLQEVLQKSVAGKPIPLQEISSRYLLEQTLSHSGQDDDMIIVKLNIPPENPEESIHLGVLSDFNSVDRACKWADEKLTEASVPAGHDKFDIMLCTREALLNAVEHGNRNNPGAYVDLTLFPDDESLKIRVSDEGSGFNLGEILNQSEQNDGFQIGKRGLSLMHAIADSIEITGGSVVMTFEHKNH